MDLLRGIGGVAMKGVGMANGLNRIMPRPRRSTSSTPVTDDGLAQPSSDIHTPKRGRLFHLKQEEFNSVENTPNGSIRQVDASFRCEDKISPTLAKLRNTPGNLFKEKQSLLLRKHEESRRRIDLDSVNVGGGVSIWPEMEKMRLTQTDVKNIAVFNICLSFLVALSFYLVHGVTLSQLSLFHTKLLTFSKQNPVHIHTGQVEFDQSVLEWHVKYKQIVDEIHVAFDMSRVPSMYLLYVTVYITIVCVLFYYLVDNMFAKSKLSPKRIKRWVCLLTVTGTWTFLLMVTLVIALRTEVSIETNIHLLSSKLGDVISTDLNSHKLHTILSYWGTRCLPPTTHGTVSIFGVLPVRDVTFYLQYYCIPIVTVLFTPIFKLIVAVMTVHNCGKQG